MTGRPILFSGPMVRAILEGRKTQTRRVLKPQPRRGWEVWRDGERWMESGYGERGDDELRVPYAIGDRLWVRENFTRVPVTAYRMSEGVQQTVNPSDPDIAAVYSEGWVRSKPGPWKPSIHMPRWASRITLTVIDVRVERVQDIADKGDGLCRIDDIEAEGLNKIFDAEDDHKDSEAAIDWFRQLWDSLNAKRGFGWEQNPWVVVLTFTAEQRNIDAPTPPKETLKVGKR